MEDYGNMFTVMPMNQTLSLTPGEEYEGSITVTNPADAKKDFNYKIDVTPYSVIGAEYAADLATKTNLSTMVDWITVENSTGTLKPNSSTKINFKIKVPEDAAGGGQYAAITVASNENQTASEGVAVENVFEMASIIYATVDGEINHVGEIKENSIPAFSPTTPVKVTARISNDGNVHESATVAITAKNFFTGETILPTDENNGQYSEMIMPGTERYTTREVDNLPDFGIIQVEQTVYYLGMSSVESVNVIICPVWFLILVIVTLGAIIAAAARAIFKHHKKKPKKTKKTKKAEKTEPEA